MMNNDEQLPNKTKQISSDKEPWLFVVESLIQGGSEKKTVMVANNLAIRGYDVHLVYLNGPDYLLKQINNQVKIVKLNRKSRVDWKAIARLREYIRKNSITRIWNVNLYSMLYGFLATRFLTHKTYSTVSVNITHFRRFQDVLHMILYVPVMYGMNRIIFGCDMQMRRWVRLYFLPKEKSTVIYNGVDPDYYREDVFTLSREEARIRYGVNKDDVVIGVVGRLMREKGHVTVIKAINNLITDGYRVKLMLAGDGAEREALEALVNSLNLQDDILFLGSIRDVREVLIAFDVFLLASLSETFSNAALEAMSMSKPVVLSNVGGSPEMVDDGVNGYLFESGNVKDLTKVLIKMMNADLREKFAHSAREKVCREYSFNRMVDDYMNV